jgi:hypothetical protein
MAYTKLNRTINYNKKSKTKAETFFFFKLKRGKTRLPLRALSPSRVASLAHLGTECLSFYYTKDISWPQNCSKLATLSPIVIKWSSHS